jgi:hypothetical protein
MWTAVLAAAVVVLPLTARSAYQKALESTRQNEHHVQTLNDSLHKDMMRQGFKQIEDYAEPTDGAILRFYEKDNTIVEVTSYTNPRAPIRHAFKWYDISRAYQEVNFNIEGWRAQLTAP